MVKRCSNKLWPMQNTRICRLVDGCAWCREEAAGDRADLGRNAEKGDNEEVLKVADQAVPIHIENLKEIAHLHSLRL